MEQIVEMERKIEKEKISVQKKNQKGRTLFAPKVMITLDRTYLRKF